MPVSAVMKSGSEWPGLTKLWNSPIISPPRTFSAPISVIAAPVDGAAPEVSRSRTTNVVYARESACDDMNVRLIHSPDS